MAKTGGLGKEVVEDHKKKYFGKLVEVNHDENQDETFDKENDGENNVITLTVKEKDDIKSESKEVESKEIDIKKVEEITTEETNKTQIIPDNKVVVLSEEVCDNTVAPKIDTSTLGLPEGFKRASWIYREDDINKVRILKRYTGVEIKDILIAVFDSFWAQSNVKELLTDALSHINQKDEAISIFTTNKQSGG